MLTFDVDELFDQISQSRREKIESVSYVFGQILHHTTLGNQHRNDFDQWERTVSRPLPPCQNFKYCIRSRIINNHSHVSRNERSQVQSGSTIHENWKAQQSSSLSTRVGSRDPYTHVGLWYNGTRFWATSRWPIRTIADKIRQDRPLPRPSRKPRRRYRPGWSHRKSRSH